MRTPWRWILLIATVLFWAGLCAAQIAKAGSLERPAFQGTSLVMLGPAACPSSGCAPGQRINLRFDFELTTYSTSADPNVKVCFYAPDAWLIAPDSTTVYQGGLTGESYQVDPAGCDVDTRKPTGYTLIAARYATIDQTTFSDSVDLAVQLAVNAAGSGRLVARLFENDGTAFALTQQSTTATLSIAPISIPSYVANDAAACGANSPCYLNSASDLPNGIGTGLRDAVEAAVSGQAISILGNYTIKSSRVLIDKSVSIVGVNDAALTYTASGACSQPMLLLTNNVTIRGLNINDGSCANPGRSLIEVNSASPVLIESNDLVNGDNAVILRDNAGPLQVRFNQITGNTGYAVYADGHSAGGALEVTANNLHANRAGASVECSASATAPIPSRKINHNYWGAAVPTPEVSHCTIAAGKRLGAPIVLRASAPGVNAQMVSVGTTKTYTFDSQIAYRRNGGADFSLYIVDHGYIGDTNDVPFTAGMGGESPNPCSSTWDVFLPDGTTASGTLELSLKYDRTPACLAVINSNQYCDQTAASSKYPLYWYDPATNATRWWDTTGQRPENLASGEGQATSCNINANEIQVAIDDSGRPSLNGDLSYTPLMVGVPVLRSFTPLASSQAITITWTTNNEPDINGFYVLRSMDGINFSPISDLIAKRGTGLTGVITPPYAFVDSGRVNGVTYYYRLQILRTDGRSIYSAASSLAANVATITPTFTASPTFTRTVPIPTNTFLPTRIFTQRPTSVPFRTFTPRPVATTVTPFVIRTATPLGTLSGTLTFSEAALTASAESTLQGTPGTPNPGDATAQASQTTTPATPTLATETGAPTATASLTVQPTAVSGATPNQGAAWASLVLGLIAGLVLVGGAGGLWYYRAVK